MLKFDLSTKRAQLALRFFTYGVMTVATVVLTTIVVFLVLGYRFDKNLSFSQGGLVQFRSDPSSAMVFIDGKMESSRTSSRANLPAGNHTVDMFLDGYRSWHKAFSLAPGQLLWLNYVKLIPKNISVSDVQSFDNIASAMASPDHRWLVMQPSADAPNFVLADISNGKNPVISNLQLADTLPTKKDNKFGKFEIVEWDASSRYVLVNHQNGDIHELIRLDRAKPQESVNITRVFSLNIGEAHFSAVNPNIIFAKTDDVLRRLDLGSTNASAALVTDLKQFIVYGEDTIAYVNSQEKTVGDPSSKQQSVGIYRHGKATSVRSLPLNQPTIIAYNEYDSHGYLAIGSTENPRIDILRDPVINGPNDSNIFAHLEMQVNPSTLSFSNNGRMLLALSGNYMSSYDLETSSAYNSKLNFGANLATPPKWLDDFHIWANAGDKLFITEFDGQNSAVISQIIPGLTATLSPNGHELFSFRKVGAKIILQSSKLTID